MPRVLVVDDEKLIVKGIRFSLEQDGMEVDCAYDGEEAVELAKKTEYDIVLLDVMLPKLDGYEVCQAIREFSDMPIIMLTAKGGDMDKILGLEYGADDYISKPFNAQLLLARANNLVRNRLLIQHQLRKKPLSEIDLTSINPLDQEMLRKTSQIIEKHIDDPDFDIPELCKEVGIGRSLLYSKFKALTGMTPNNFVLNYRLKHAATLLRRYSDLPIAEVSDRCGFSSPVYFSRCFKNQYGCTPQSYQKRKDSEV